MTTLVLLGPRAGILVWWLASPGRWDLAFDSFLWPLLGFIFAPWTTLMYVAVFQGGVNGFDWFWMVLAILADVASWTSGAYSNRSRFQTA
jgi:hypothetical protein